MGVENTSGTDTRTENAEQPPSRDNPPGPPPDRPGSPGQPSRLESLRAAREAQEARRAETQQTTAREIGTEQGTEPEKEEAEPSSAEGADAEAEPKDAEATQETGRSGPESDERERETGRPDIEEARPDGLGEQPSAAETGALTSETSTERREEDKNDKAEPSSPDATTGRPDAPTDPHTVQGYGEVGEAQPDAGETGQSDGRGEEPRLQEIPENSSESPDEHGLPEPRDADADESEAQDRPPLARQGDQGPVADGSESHLEPGTEQRHQGAEESSGHEEAPPEPAPADQQDDRIETGQPVEEPARAPDNPQPSNPPELRVAWPPAPEEFATRWTSPVVHFNDRTPGTQVELRDTNIEGLRGTSATTDDPNKYRNLPDIPRDGVPGRGELIPPEDDPASRDYLEPAPERSSRRMDLLRGAHNKTADTVKSANQYTRQAESILKDKPPTGHPTTTKDSGPFVSAKQQHVKGGDVVIGVLGGAIILTEAGRRTYAYSKQLIGRFHGGNR